MRKSCTLRARVCEENAIHMQLVVIKACRLLEMQEQRLMYIPCLGCAWLCFGLVLTNKAAGRYERVNR